MLLHPRWCKECRPTKSYYSYFLLKYCSEYIYRDVQQRHSTYSIKLNLLTLAAMVTAAADNRFDSTKTILYFFPSNIPPTSSEYYSAFDTIILLRLYN